MPITLAQAQELSQSKLTKEVYGGIRKSPLLDLLQFDNTVLPGGGQTLAYVYNRIKTMATAASRAINSEYVPQEADTEQVTVNLKVFGGSFQVDRVIAQHQVQAVDHVQFQIEQKRDATIAMFHDQFINGDSSVGAGLAFDGLDKAITGSSTEYIPTANIDLSTAAAIKTNWFSLTDALRKMRALMDGTPTVFMMNSDMFAVFQSVMDQAGAHLLTKENYGFEALQWGPSIVMPLGDKPGTSLPIIETDNDGLTSIFAARLALSGVHGVSPAGNKVVNTYLPNMLSAEAVKLGGVEMVAAMALKSTRSAAVLRGVKIG